MDDQNHVILEGTVKFVQEAREANGKQVCNFVVDNIRKTKLGTQSFKYNCVAWEKTLEKFGDRIKEGKFIRIVGHLQDSVLKLDNGTDFHYCKVCCDFIDASE